MKNIRVIGVVLLLIGVFGCSPIDNNMSNEFPAPPKPTIATEIPTMVISTPDNCKIVDKEHWIENASICMKYSDGRIENLGEVSIKLRGNSSSKFPKLSYNIKFQDKMSLLGMPSGKRWCLLAQWMDKTLLRNDVSFEIARRLSGLKWTPKGRFVELELNGEKLCLYYLSEKIRIDKNRIDIDEEHGFVVELDVYYDEVNKFKSISGLPVMIKEPSPESIDRTELDSFIDYFNNTERKLRPLLTGTTTNYRKNIDINSFVDYWIVYELSGNGEPVHPKSCYMYKDVNGPIFAGPVWDFDWCTYCLDDTEIKNITRLWYKYLFKDPAFCRIVKQRWAGQKGYLLDIPEYIDSQASLIHDCAINNFQRWPINQKVNKDEYASWETAITMMKMAYNDRYHSLDKFIENLSD